MRGSSIALALAAAAVAAGGIYLYVSLDSDAGATTPEQALASARAEAGGSGDRADRGDGDHERARPGAPIRRNPRAAFDPDSKVGIPGPQFDLRKNADQPPPVEGAPKYQAFDADPVTYAAPTAEQSEQLLEANKLYDRGDFEGARSLAQKLLGQMPDNVRMLRVVVSSSCIMGEGDVAQKYATRLPQADHEAMVARCAKFQIDLK